MMNYADLPYKHDKNCKCKDSSNIRKEHIECLKQGNENIICHYDAYCKECGVWLYEFNYGHMNMY